MKDDKSGTGLRAVHAEVKLDARPEDAWLAIATGKGISAWFVPTDFKENEDGTPRQVISHFGPGMDSVSDVVAWNPPHNFVADSHDLGPDAPAITTEWSVRNAGNEPPECVVRVTHTLETERDEWDGQLEMWRSGWFDFFRILRLYLAHFSNQPSAAFQLMANSNGPATQAWGKLTKPFGLHDAGTEQQLSPRPGVPALGGITEFVGQGDHPEQLLLRLDQPATGLAHLFVMPMGESAYAVIRVYLYGDRAAEVAAEVEPQWTTWLNDLFPAA